MLIQHSRSFFSLDVLVEFSGCLGGIPLEVLWGYPAKIQGPGSVNIQVSLMNRV